MASSKSFASSQSIVKVNNFVKSFLFKVSFCHHNFDISFIIHSEKLIFTPVSKIKLFIISSLLFLFFPVQIISFTIHSGFLSFHFLILIPTKSHSFAQLKCFLSMKILLKILLFGNTKPKLFLPTFKIQTINHFLLSNIFVITASFLHLNFFISASTLSQSKVFHLFFPNTKYHFSCHFTSIKPNHSFSLYVQIMVHKEALGILSFILNSALFQKFFGLWFFLFFNVS
ncbi:MAG: hypothetical protein LBQ24_00105 [Candidatus Peribacteria bacterium]|jgi:hypothetical protein|nr:hypothetical protein [Candidatus Peribacteria bacterium]